MVLDHILKTQYTSDKNTETLLHSMSSVQKNKLINKEVEVDFRNDLQLEINKLIYQKNSDAIVAVKEVSTKESKRLRKKEKNRDNGGLTS